MNKWNLAQALKASTLKKAINWKEAMPAHIAIMMDGNGRWATRKGLPRTAGHFAGMNTMRDIIRVCSTIKLKYLTLYAFSTENWKRPSEEVEYIIQLISEFVTESSIQELNRNHVKIKFIGDISKFSKETQNMMCKAVRDTHENTGLTVNFAMNYGGRDEILHALRTFLADDKEELSPEEFDAYLYTAGCPSPDLIIRTSGEQRLSGFLLWQAAQAELWFTDEMWPDFNKNLLYKAMYDYQQRKLGT